MCRGTFLHNESAIVYGTIPLIQRFLVDDPNARSLGCRFKPFSMANSSSGLKRMSPSNKLGSSVFSETGYFNIERNELIS